MITPAQPEHHGMLRISDRNLHKIPPRVLAPPLLQQEVQCLHLPVRPQPSSATTTGPRALHSHGQTKGTASGCRASRRASASVSPLPRTRSPPPRGVPPLPLATADAIDPLSQVPELACRQRGGWHLPLQDRAHPSTPTRAVHTYREGLAAEGGNSRRWPVAAAVAGHALAQP